MSSSHLCCSQLCEASGSQRGWLCSRHPCRRHASPQWLKWRVFSEWLLTGADRDVGTPSDYRSPAQGEKCPGFSSLSPAPSSVLLLPPTGETCWEPQSLQGSVSGVHAGTWRGKQESVQCPRAGYQVKTPAAKPWSCHLLALWLKASCLTSLYLSFLLWKRR